MSELIKEFNDYRTRMNEVILDKNNLVMKRLWNLDTNTYEDGALDKKTKELIALALGIAARCDGCIGFHVKALVKLSVTREEFLETLGMAVYMGGGPSLMYAADALTAYEEFTAV